MNGYFDLGDGTLYYETAGAGDALVLSHAAFLDSRMFDAQWELLAQHFQVIRYDMRGYGQSSPAQGPICRRDDLSRLLKHLGVEQAHFVGCSNGGEIILDLALEQPGLALSLTLVNSTPSGFELQGEPPRYIMEMVEAAQRGDIDRVNELQIRIWLDGSFREPEAVDRDLRAKALAMNRIPVERQTYFMADMQPTCPLDSPAINRLHEVQIPVLIITGALDHAEVLRAADIMATTIPGARKVTIESTGHVPSYERPEVFNPLLLDFLHMPQTVIR
jgi:pimeloyl-ACP methyl ester carboxylesterase